ARPRLTRAAARSRRLRGRAGTLRYRRRPRRLSRKREPLSWMTLATPDLGGARRCQYRREPCLTIRDEWHSRAALETTFDQTQSWRYFILSLSLTSGPLSHGVRK